MVTKIAALAQAAAQKDFKEKRASVLGDAAKVVASPGRQIVNGGGFLDKAKAWAFGARPNPQSATITGAGITQGTGELPSRAAALQQTMSGPTAQNALKIGGGVLAGAGGMSMLGGGKAEAAPAIGDGAGPGATPGSGAGGLMGAANGMLSGAQDQAGRAMEWVKANPGKAALMGLGGAGVGYGLSKLMGGRKKKRDKEASDKVALPRTRSEFLKRAADTVRHNSVVILGRYLTKLSADAPAAQRQGLRQMQASLIMGNNIYTAIGDGFPHIKTPQRVKVAQQLVKRAMQDFDDDVNSESSGSSFTGTPNEGASWMKSNC